MQYLIYILCLLISANAYEVQAKKPQASIRFTSSNPIIDGDLTDPSWQEATTINQLTQVWPKINSANIDESKSKVKLMYNEEYLLVSADLFSDHTPITANTLQYNQDTTGDDSFTMLIDTFGSKQNAYWFSVNPNSVKNDGLIVNNTKNIPEWNGVWYASSKITEEGWAVEMAIPFKMLSFDPKADAWGLNIIHKVAQSQTELRWTNINQNSEYFAPEKFGLLTGLKEIDQGYGLDIRLSTVARDVSSPSEKYSEITPSLDVFYKWTPAISTALTLNTDFSNTDVDERQLNLGRFNLFLPEKRDFFLQDAGIFEFGGLNKNGRPFFSRKIGLDPHGKPIDINAGLKFSGFGERWGFGLLSVNTEDVNNQGTQQLTVARGTWQVNEHLKSGFMITDGDPSIDLSNQTFGLDFDFRDHSFLTDKTLELGAWLQRNNTEGINKDDMAWGLSASYPNDIINVSVSFKELQKNFKPALGFVNRTDIRKYSFEGRYRHHLDKFGIQLLDHSLNAYVTTDLTDKIKTSTLFLNYLNFTTYQGDFLRLAVEDTNENLIIPFNFLNKVVIEPLDYHYNRYWLIANTSTARSWIINATWNTGQFYSGDKDTISVELKWRPSININTAIKIRNDDININQQNINFSQIKLTLDLTVSNTLSWQNYFQYDDLSRQLGISSRLHWVYKPEFESHISFNSNYLKTLDDSFQQEVRELTFRVGGMWRF